MYILYMYNKRQIKQKGQNMQGSRLSKRSQVNQSTSPIKSKQYQTLNPQKKQIINKLLYLFTYYSSKVSKYCYRELNQKYFMELISDMHEVMGKTLIRNKNQYKDFQNAYYSRGRKHGLLFKDFLQLLPVVSIYFVNQYDRQHAMQAVIQAILAVYDAKVGPSLQGQLVDYDEPINDQTKQFILKLYPSFNVIYKVYFAHQVAGKFNNLEPEQESFEFFLNLMKDFEIYPKLISASSLYFLYHETLKAQANNLLHETEYSQTKVEQKGNVFTLSKFVECIVSSSRLCFSKLKILQNPEYDSSYQKQILKTLLEYMQTIKSTKSQFKNSIFKEHRFSFIVYEEYPQESLMKTFVLKDRIVKETQKQMDFFKLFDKIKI